MKRFFKSLRYALYGWKLFFKTERNGQIQLIAAILVIILGFFLKLHIYEWAIILICIGLVLSLEMVNSAVEKLIDHLHPDNHNAIKWIKDVAAGAVLWSAVISVVVAVVILIPKILSFF